MKILVSLFLLFSFPAGAACRFNEKAQSVYSLSGPMSAVLEELGLLTSSNVKGLTIFYPAPSEFHGDTIPGGVFLSPGKLDEMKGSVIFYDSSQELEKVLKARGIRGVAIATRKMTPSQVTNELIKTLRPFVQECDEKIKSFEQKVSQLEKTIREKMKRKWNVVFFLGEISGPKLPELVIANDGLSMWLRQEKLISTYPSELAYVNWSASVLNDLQDYKLIGLKESQLKKVSGEKLRMTLAYPGVLNPGIRQLEAWNYFLDESEKRK
jgi:hypothetical protein